MKTLIPLILLASIAASPVQAEEAKRATVQLADLDLSSPRDQHVLDQRIAGALEQVCGSYAGADYAKEARIRACRADLTTKLQTSLAEARTARAGTAVAAR